MVQGVTSTPTVEILDPTGLSEETEGERGDLLLRLSTVDKEVGDRGEL